MELDQERAPVNKALMRMAAVVGLSLDEVHDCAEWWKAGCGVDIRDPTPEEMSHLEDDVLHLTCLRRILEGYKAYKKVLRKKKRRGS